MEKKFKTLHTKERTFDIITFLAKAQNISKVTLMSNVFEALFDAGSNTPENARMLIDVTGNQAMFTFAGRPVVKSGTAKNDAEMKKQLETAFNQDREVEEK